MIEHPFWYLAFLLCFGAISVYFLKVVFGSVTLLNSRVVYVLIIISALSHFLLLSLILTAYEAIILLYRSELRTVKNVKILSWTCCLLIFFTIGWTCYIQLLIHYIPDYHMTVIETVRKLYNYPKIYEKVVRPVVDLGILYEVVISCLGVAAVFFYALKKTENKTIAFVLLLILMASLGTGVTKWFYSHIRYFYYIYPLLLFFLAFLAVSVWHYVNKFKIPKMLFVAGLTAFVLWQITISWKVVNAVPGSEERFSYSRRYLDHKTCCNYLNENRSESDYVIAFASAHQSAVYCGNIDAAIRPKLKLYWGQDYHYITGSKFFATKEELISIIKGNIKNDENIWVIVCKRYFKEGSWEYEFLERLRDYAVCEASENYTSLIRISPQDFLTILGYQFHQQ